MERCLRMVLIGLAGAIMLMAGLGCKDGTTGPRPVWKFSGFVTDSITEEPIESAFVSVHDTSGKIGRASCRESV